MHQCSGIQQSLHPAGSCRVLMSAAAPIPVVHKLHEQAARQGAPTLTKSAVLNWKTPCSSCLPYVTTQTISIKTLKLGLPMNRKGVTSRQTCSQHRPGCIGGPDTCLEDVWEAQHMLQPPNLRYHCSVTNLHR